jgi:phage terminase large subunit-like protein
VPEDATEKPENRHYAGWVAQEHLIATPGDMIDYDYIEADIKADAARHRIIQIGYDRWDASQVVQHLQNHIGADKLVQVPMTTEHLSHPMKHLAGLIQSGRIHHDGNLPMAWMIGNVTAQTDRNDNVFPRKERAERKIDGAVALIVALSRELREPKTTSIYETRGVVTV